MQLARENFLKFDTDNDGVISLADFSVAMAKHDPSWTRPERRDQLRAMYSAVDSVGDGLVRFEEFAIMRVRKKGGGGATPRTIAATTMPTPRCWTPRVGGTPACPPMPPMPPMPHTSLEAPRNGLALTPCLVALPPLHAPTRPQGCRHRIWR